jgi:4-azaleucine resistance transporter AzlC
MSNLFLSRPQARQFFAGVRDMLPLIVGIVPFALISGIAAVKVGIPPGTALALSWLVYAGASQLVAYQLMATDTPLIMVLLSTLVVNLRFMMYSAALAPHFAKLALRLRAVYAYIMTDQSFALSVAHYAKHGSPTEKPAHHWYFFGGALSMILAWQISGMIGIFVGTALPPAWGLEFSIPLSFLALLAPIIKDRPMVLAAVAAAGCAALTGGLPYRIGLILSAFVGITVGLVAESALPTSAVAVSHTPNEDAP